LAAERAKANFRGKQVAKKALSGKLGPAAKRFVGGYLKAGRDLQGKITPSREPRFSDLGFEYLPKSLSSYIEK